jgi:hypothetical protein
VANAGLVVPATLMVRLGLEGLINQSVRLVGRVGGSLMALTEIRQSCSPKFAR